MPECPSADMKCSHWDSVYVSFFKDSTVSKFSLIEMHHVRSIGGKGPNNGQFDGPRHLTAVPIGRVFIADSRNDRICIHDLDLNHLSSIAHHSISRPFDIKVSRDRLYVLCPDINPCMHVLTLEGDILCSLITCGKRKDVVRPYFFCLDSLNNFVISDYCSDSIRIFSPEGNLLQTIGRERDQYGMFCNPEGVAIAFYSIVPQF